MDEAPSLNALQRRIEPLGGTVLGVSLDEDPAAYEDFLKTYQIGFPTYRDPSNQIALDYGTPCTPKRTSSTERPHRPQNHRPPGLALPRHDHLPQLPSQNEIALASPPPR